eukprot:3330972-Heterocapsa_arctica.AAC.1
MALSDGRSVPHGKHADLHRRAIQAMEGRTSDRIQEHMEGNKEADKLASLGVEMHEVPETK